MLGVSVVLPLVVTHALYVYLSTICVSVCVLVVTGDAIYLLVVSVSSTAGLCRLEDSRTRSVLYYTVHAYALLCIL